MLYSIIGMLVIILDQLVKFWVDRNINWTNPVRAVIPNVLSLVRVQNDGAAFSFLSGSGARVWFIVLTGVFALLVVLALATNFVSGKFGRWCLVFVTAGGLSNMIDRIRYGFVLDMFKLEVIDFAVFNVADIFITVFCIAFIIYILFGGEKVRESETDEFDRLDLEEEDRPKRSPKKSTRRSRDFEDEDEYIRPERRAPVKKTGKQTREYDDNYEEEDLPRRNAERAEAAAANAYNRRNTKPDSMQTVHRQRPINQEPSPAQRIKTSSTSNESSQRVAVRSKTYDPQVEEMFVEKTAPVKTHSSVSARRPVSAVPSVQKKPSQKPIDPDNPFAEWEQANERAAKQTAATVKEVSAQSIRRDSPVSSNNDDFNIDDILNEFK